MLLWGLVYLALTAATWAVLGSFYLALLSHLAANARLGAAGLTQAENAALPQMTAMQGWTWLLSLTQGFVAVIVYCAVFRAVLHPEQKRFGYLRVGATELLLFVLAVAAYIVFTVAGIVVAVVAAMLFVALFVMHAQTLAVVLGVISAVAAIVAVVWIALRFSMVGPMMVADGRFHLFESWARTRGRGGALFILGLCLTALVLVVELVILGLLLVAGVAALAPAAGGLANLGSFVERSPSVVASALAPVLVVAAIILAPVAGCLHAILGAPWARAYLDLTSAEPAAVAA